MRNLWIFGMLFFFWMFSAVGCYYTPATKRAKADSSYIGEAETESLMQSKLAPYGFKFICNMKLQRGTVMFVADGYDRDMRVGFEYRSHEGMDFEGEKGQSPNGLTDEEISALKQREKDFREYFLIIPEGTREEVEQKIDDFIKDLYAWEVLKKTKENKDKDSLFPEKKDQKDDLLPWEATGNLTKKRKQMEQEEKLDDSGSDGSSWETVEKPTTDEEWGESKDQESSEEKEKKPEEKKKKKEPVEDEDF